MSGHSKWSQIKHQKEITDQKRGALFSKLLNSIAVAARSNPNPESNPTLRSAIEKAKSFNVPQSNIERALNKAAEKNSSLEELILEAYGPSGVAILIEAITDNRNRTVAEIKKILNEENGKWAEVGSVRWAFIENRNEESRWQAKFPQLIPAEDLVKLNRLIESLENHPDIQSVSTTASQN